MRKSITIATAALLLIVVLIGFAFWQETHLQTQTTPSPTPAPTVAPLKFTVTTATASPSNTTPGIVTIVAEVTNLETTSEIVIVAYQIQEPNGNIMDFPNNSTILELTANSTKIVTFTPNIPLNSKIGKFHVDIDIYNSNQTVKYYSTGFIYHFTTPIQFVIGFDGYLVVYGTFNKTVDGVTYPMDSRFFYWYLGTNHTISVPNIVWNDNGQRASQFSSWYGADTYHSDGNTLYVTVTANGRTTIGALYNPLFK